MLYDVGSRDVSYRGLINDIHYSAKRSWSHLIDLHRDAEDNHAAKGRIFKSIRYLDVGYDLLLQINEVYWRWKEDPDKEPGFEDYQHMSLLWDALRKEQHRLYIQEGLIPPPLPWIEDETR